MKRTYLLSGVAAPLVYAFTVILGGALWRDYSHISQAISELTAAGAPFRLPLNILFSISLVLAAVFALAAYHYVSRYNIRLLKASMGILLTITVLSFLWAFFPMDPRGAEATVQGIIHLVLAGIVSPLTIICPILVGLGFRKIEGFKGYAAYSLLSAALILATGALAALSTQNDAAYLGVYARLTIGSYQQWFLCSALIFYARS